MIPNYVPSETEEYMNPQQLEYFSNLLLQMRAGSLPMQSEQIISATATYEADMSDNASIESESFTEQRTRDVKSKNLREIDESLARIKTGEYGYCIESGKKIGLKRLLANPTAKRSIDEQEKYERSGRTDDDY